MKLGRVMGRVVATVRAADLDGEKLLVLQPLDSALQPEGEPLVACDVVSSGLDDLVFWIGGKEAAMALRRSFVPVDATIVGHVEAGSSEFPTVAKAPPDPAAG